jgi:hypothetical protein
MSFALGFILLLGFVPTLYGRVFFDVPPIPLRLHVHGAVLSLWFAWFAIQPTLIALDRMGLHRRTGIVGAIIAIAVIPAALSATLGSVARLRGLGIDVDAEIYLVSWVVWGNFCWLLAFAGFVFSALLFRHRPKVHKRLMLLASLSIVGPPLARISHWPVFDWATEIPFVVAGSLILLLPLVLMDLLVEKRLHRATIIGVPSAVLAFLAPLVIAGSDFAQSYVRTMGL